jgi:dTDP-N-acetylfucosamine:lipid II N-acetylfucosaminyltransferase
MYQSVRYLYSFPRALNRAKLSAIGRINYCATTVEPEITLIRQKLNKSIQWLPFSMLDAEEMIPDNDRERLKSSDKSAILVGNSSDPRNNHYEILQTLKEKQVKNEIICPLSYGDDAYAGKLLKSVEGWYQPGQLVAITKFIPRNEYYQLLDKVGIAIMGHNVQQAFGNIIGLLCMGAKLYLKKQNFLYPLFLSWGVAVFHMEQLNNKNAFEKLDQKTAERNREIITTRYSKATVDRLYTDFLSV